MHAGKLGQVTNLTIVGGGTAKYRVDQYMVLYRFCSLCRAGYMLGFATYF